MMMMMSMSAGAQELTFVYVNVAFVRLCLLLGVMSAVDWRRREEKLGVRNFAPLMR